MGLKDGNKQTEVGIIPEDWEVESLGDLTTLLTNGFVGTATRHYTNSDDGILYIQGFNVEENSFNFTGIKRVTKEFHKNNSKSCLREGDLLTIQTGDVGLTTIVPKRLEGSNCHALIISRFKKNKAYPKFYSQYFNSFVGRNRLKDIETGTTMKHLNVGDMVTWKLPCPPLPEQQAIAEALSDVDALTTSLDQLITKKRNIKQGAMQQLLTGKKRLAGFSGDWETKTLGEIGDFKNGINKGKDDFGFGFPFVNLMDIFGISKVFPNLKFGLVNSSVAERKMYELKKGDVLFVRSSVKPEGVGLSSLVTADLENTVYSGFLIRFRDYGKLDFEFKEHCFFEEDFRQRLIDNSTVSANTNINQDALKKLTIYLPPTKEEQKAIAQILNDMNAQIEKLKQQRDKYKAVKQGMMQELLTGKTRLVKPEAEAATIDEKSV